MIQIDRDLVTSLCRVGNRYIGRWMLKLIQINTQSGSKSARNTQFVMTQIEQCLQDSALENRSARAPRTV
ncbi:hypothetical protein BDS110ZK19_74590 [Bradyrhizobium diazoefficiens]